ncbi:hypothetical protein C8T65DRAFT_700287 [Cerioporus squamosus]|nr:hypothetical protein C8T65DRAFT_700287 [Cerioporus squamosus]
MHVVDPDTGADHADVLRAPACTDLVFGPGGAGRRVRPARKLILASQECYFRERERRFGRQHEKKRSFESTHLLQMALRYTRGVFCQCLRIDSYKRCKVGRRNQTGAKIGVARWKHIGEQGIRREDQSAEASSQSTCDAYHRFSNGTNRHTLSDLQRICRHLRGPISWPARRSTPCLALELESLKPDSMAAVLLDAKRPSDVTMVKIRSRLQLANDPRSAKTSRDRREIAHAVSFSRGALYPGNADASPSSQIVDGGVQSSVRRPTEGVAGLKRHRSSSPDDAQTDPEHIYRATKVGDNRCAVQTSPGYACAGASMHVVPASSDDSDSSVDLERDHHQVSNDQGESTHWERSSTVSSPEIVTRPASAATGSQCERAVGRTQAVSTVVIARLCRRQVSDDQGDPAYWERSSTTSSSEEEHENCDCFHEVEAREECWSDTDMDWDRALLHPRPPLDVTDRVSAPPAPSNEHAPCANCQGAEASSQPLWLSYGTE